MKSIADAFAAKLAELVQGIDAADFNPVKCCLCAYYGRPGTVEVIVAGYGVCTDHMIVMDKGGTVEAALKLEPQKKRRAS